jgi:hypothetical protein
MASGIFVLVEHKRFKVEARQVQLSKYALWQKYWWMQRLISNNCFDLRAHLTEIEIENYKWLCFTAID